MERKRRIRATKVVRGDSRAVGTYEQSDFSSNGSAERRLAAALGSTAGLSVSGMVGRGPRLSFSELRALATDDRVSSFDAAFISVVDLLAGVRADSDAEVLAIDTVDGDRIAFRLNSFLSDSGACLELGAVEADGRRNWRRPIQLHGQTLPGQRSVDIMSIRLTTFAEFVDRASLVER